MCGGRQARRAAKAQAKAGTGMAWHGRSLREEMLGMPTYRREEGGVLAEEA